MALVTFSITCLNLRKPVRQLRSNRHNQLDINRACTVADRAFRKVASSVWNSLLLYITDNLDSPAAGFKSAQFDPRPPHYRSVGTGMGDRLRAGIPPRYVTSHPSQLSLLPSVGREMSTGQSAVILWE